MRNWILRIVGFVVGVSLALVLEYGLFLLLGEIFDRRMIPRGAGWAVIPILAGIGLAKLAPEIVPASRIAKQGILKSYWSASPLVRFVVVAPIFWMFAVGAYVLLFEPYGYRMTSRHYEHMFKVMLFPPIVLVVGYFVYSKLIQPSKHGKLPESRREDV